VACVGLVGPAGRSASDSQGGLCARITTAAPGGARKLLAGSSARAWPGRPYSALVRRDWLSRQGADPRAVNGRAEPDGYAAEPRSPAFGAGCLGVWVNADQAGGEFRVRYADPTGSSKAQFRLVVELPARRDADARPLAATVKE